MSTQISPAAAAVGSTSQRIALRCSGLVKRFSDVTAVNGLDLEIYAGECFGLLGPNGAGKTTTVEILEGLTPSDEGTVELLGQRWKSGDDRALRERIGVQLTGNATCRESYSCRDVETVSQFLPTRSRALKKSFTRSRSKKNETHESASSPAVRNNDSRLRARSSAIRNSCFSTSRPPGSIRKRVSRFGTSWKSFATVAGRFS